MDLKKWLHQINQFLKNKKCSLAYITIFTAWNIVHYKCESFFIEPICLESSQEIENNP